MFEEKLEGIVVWPSELDPQQARSPFVVTAHVWKYPADTDTMFEEKLEGIVVWPYELSPQQARSPIVVTAHVCLTPAVSFFEFNSIFG